MSFPIDRPASGLIMNRGHFLFVPDTPKMLMRITQGKSPNGQQRTDATGVAPQLSV